MTNRIIHIISNIKAIGWVTILVFSSVLYYCIYSLIGAYLINEAKNSMLSPVDMVDPDINEMTELLTQLTLIFTALGLISIVGIFIGRGLLKIKKWAFRGFHILSISVGILILAGVAYLLFQQYTMPPDKSSMIHIGFKVQTISLGTLGLLITWLITKVNILLFRKEYKIEMK